MLVIKNWKKIIGDSFLDDRFLCTNFEEKPTLLSFWFKDLKEAGGIWVEINRQKEWSPTDNEWLYTLIYPNSYKHYVTADWFSDIDNARYTFQTALEYSIKQ